MTATSGRVDGDEPDELLAGARLAENLDSVLGEQPCEPLPDDDGVVGEDHAHGIAAVTRVPSPAALSTSRWPSSASTRSRSPRRPAPSASAPPTPSSATSIATRPFVRATAIVARDACACLATLASASLATKYAVASTGAGRRSGETVSSTGTGARRASAASAAARPSSVRIAGWMPRASARSSSSAPPTSASASVEQLVDGAVPVGESAAGELECEPDPEQALLGAVVEVALEPPPLGVAGLDDPRARGAHLGELGAQLRLQARVLEREARGRADGLEQRGLVEERRVVDERGDPPAVVLEHGDGAPVARAHVERAPAGIDVALVRRQPESELERRVAERAGDRVADILGSRGRTEPHDQIGDTGTLQAGAQEADEEGDRNDREGPPGPGERRVLDLAPDGVHDQVGDEQEDRDRARQEDGGERATRRPARGSQLPHEQDAGHNEDSDDEDVCGRLKDLRNRV